MLVQLNSEEKITKNSKEKENGNINYLVNSDLAKQILQSGQNMYFYNKNQIKKMQIKKGEF